MYSLRLRFSKTGKASYISHLDLMSTFQRVFSRAGYRLAYSEGYNPHPALSIALPLSVCTESVCEILDFELAEDFIIDEIKTRLNRVMPEGISVIECYNTKRKIKELKYIEIVGEFEFDDAKSHDRSLNRFFMESKEIPVLKKTKNGMKTIDILPMIKRIDFTNGVMDAVVSAQNPTLNPELITLSVNQLNRADLPDFVQFRRIETFDEDMVVFR